MSTSFQLYVFFIYIIRLFLFSRYLLNSSTGQLASVRALELRQAIIFKKEIAASGLELGDAAEPEALSSTPKVMPSLSARARPEARVAAAHAVELAAKRRAAAKGMLTQKNE